jgi:hypothetical protein
MLRICFAGWVFCFSSVLILVSLISSPAVAGETEAVVRIPGATIQITSPIHESTSPPVAQTLALFYISTNPNTGFSSNINLMRQTFSGDLNAFRVVSLEQFKTLGMTVVQEKIVGTGSGAVLEIEYTGALQGRSLHWLAHAVKVEGSILLATCTSTPQSWATDDPLCRAGLASLRVTHD